MIQCPSCSGAVKYNITSGKLSCDYCQSEYDPYSFDEHQGDAEERDYFETNIFTCPQCGGEIMSDDNTAAGFCSFCGASTVLNSRIQKKKRPSHIIPFCITKEQCKELYHERIKKAIYLPSAFRDFGAIEEFRGIYMPYWSYRVEQKGELSGTGEKEHRSGNYRIIDHYALSGTLDADIAGITHDAAATFSDDISERLEPFDVHDTKTFTPAFLSGFYADIADVDENVYRKDAISFAQGQTYGAVSTNDVFSGHNADFPHNLGIPARITEVKATMFPVWFLSYRYMDRVAYAAVNGQNGKIVADLPADPKKYLIGTLLLSIPAFLLFQIILYLTAPTMLIITSICALVCMICSFVWRSKLKTRSQFLNDAGYQFMQSQKTEEAVDGNATVKNAEQKRTGPSAGPASVWPLALLILAIVISVLVSFSGSIHDPLYYGLAIADAILIFINGVSILRIYNLAVSRPLPQFDRKGGDDRA